MKLSSRLSQRDVKDLRIGQRKMTHMLSVFDKLCRKHDLPYWCEGNTLHGVQFHQGWVPWDAAVHVGMLEHHLTQFVAENDPLPATMLRQTLPLHKIVRLRDKYSHYKKTETRTARLGLVVGLLVGLAVGRHVGYTWLTLCIGGIIGWEMGNRLYFHNGLQVCITPYKRTRKDMLRACTLFGKKRRSRPYNDVFPLGTGTFEGIEVFIPRVRDASTTKYPPPVDKRFPKEGRIDPSKPSQRMLQYYKHVYFM
jgi:hypothetical protein